MERRLFVPGACTSTASELFISLDEGNRDPVAIAAAQEICAACIQRPECGSQREAVQLELQKSGIFSTVIAQFTVESKQLPKEVLESSRMFQGPALKWKLRGLPPDPAQALSFMRQANRGKRVSGRLSIQKNPTMRALYAATDSDIHTLCQEYGGAGSAAYDEFPLFLRMFVTCAGLVAAPSFSTEQRDLLLATKREYLRDVKALFPSYGENATSLARNHDANYYEQLWDYYAANFNIPSGSFRLLVKQNSRNPTKKLDSLIAANPLWSRKLATIKSRDTTSYTGRRNKKPDTVKVAAGREALKAYEDDARFSGAYLDTLARQYEEEAPAEAEVRLKRLQALEALTHDSKLALSQARLMKIVMRYEAVPTTRQELLGVTRVMDFDHLMKDGVLQSWMVRRAGYLYESEAKFSQVIATVRSLINRHYLAVTTDPDVIKASHSRCGDDRTLSTLIPTERLLAFTQGERSALVYRFNLAAFLGEPALTAADIAARWHIRRPKELANVLLPFMERPPGITNDQERDKYWNRIRYEIHSQKRLVPNPQPYDDIFEQVWQRIEQATVLLPQGKTSEAVKQCVRYAIAALHINRDKKLGDIKRIGLFINTYIKEAQQLMSTPMTDAERFSVTLLFGTSYWNELTAFGSAGLTRLRLEQALSFCGLQKEPGRSPHSDVTVDQIIKALPAHERAAVYIVHNTPQLFDSTMRDEGWHIPSKIMKHCRVVNKQELLRYVKSHIMPKVAKKREASIVSRLRNAYPDYGRAVE